ncbi:vWA domain-containing protein [Tengunoibacter tsumagoiensis]|uniref:VWFA domain-containing protein n=1 Tax=Tengunoibacter tsumagoiensis TaxID=2014871 RepID=A0A402A237_9CHLR|nr:vWA domain-containing protein [Tengunoibacter tsumagoiensis]GCE13061.1 hypothetical protein KTT_29200 [Tengunoibacter tsumagoiensis]
MQKITEISNKSSQRYTNDVYQKAKNDFEKHKEYYVSIIRNLVDSFAKEFTTAALKGMTLGFSLSELVENLSKEKALDIGAEILNALEKEVTQNIALSINYHIQRLNYDRRRIFARIDKKKSRLKTERLIRKVGWDILKPLVENTIKAVFIEHFEEQVSENLPYWIQLASMREVVRPLQDISYEIPGVDTQYATADKIMFGGTPFEQTLDKAAIRFIDKRYEDKKKVLVIISDGEFLQSKRTLLTAELLKKRGIIIISCVIARQDILTGFIQPAYPKWPAGVQKMLEVASEFSTNDPTLSWGYIQHQITEGKLCLQINHTSLLEDVFKTVFQYDEKEIFS